MKKDERLINKTEIRMLRWTQGVSLREHISNEEEMRKAATVQPITTRLMQKRPCWYGHVRRRDDSYDKNSAGHGGRSVRPRRRPTLRYMVPSEDISRRMG